MVKLLTKLLSSIVYSMASVLEYLSVSTPDNYNLLDLNTHHPSNRPAHDLTAPFALRPLLWAKYDHAAPVSDLAAELDPGRIDWCAARARSGHGERNGRVDGWLGRVRDCG